VDPEVCIGCGVCTPTCQEEAIRLEVRERISPPMSLQEFISARLKA